MKLCVTALTSVKETASIIYYVFAAENVIYRQ